MNARLISGAVLALGGGTAAGIAIAGMAGTGDCGYPGVPVCPPSTGGHLYLLGTGFTLAIAGLILFGFGWVSKVAGAPQDDAEARQFRESAVRTTGVVVALADTGRTAGNDPVARITISYTRADGTAANVETTGQVPRLAVPRPGDAATVWYDPAGGKAMAELASTGLPHPHSAAAPLGGPGSPHAAGGSQRMDPS